MKRVAATRRPRKIAKTPAPSSTPGDAGKAANKWKLRLYVAGQTPKSITAFTNLKKLCDEHLSGRYEIEIVDLVENPQLAQGDQILALPTLIRKIPKPLKRVIGDLSNEERFLVGLDLKLDPN